MAKINWLNKQRLYTRVLLYVLITFLFGVRSSATTAGNIQLNDALILVHPSEPTYVQYAAKDLAGYLGELTGHSIQVGSSAGALQGRKVAIVIGQQMAQQLSIDTNSMKGMEREGSVIWSLNRSELEIVLVAGADPHGTNVGVATLIQMVRADGKAAYLEGPLDLRSEPAIPVRGFHMNGGWQLNYPYGFRTWKEEDWKRFVDIVWAERGNLVFMWPYVETMTVPLTRENQAYLEEFRRITEYAKKQRGMEVWIMQAANRVALTECEVADPRLRPHWIDGCQKDMDPADPQQFAKIEKSFEALYRTVNNADAFCLIDSDPGGWPQSPLSDQLKIFLTARKLLDRYNVNGQKAKLVDWMWIGWGRHRSFKAPGKLGTVFDWTSKNPDADDVSFMADTIRNFKNNLAGPWEMVAGMAPYLESARRESALERTIYLPYGAIEMEPAFPSTNMGFEPVKEALGRRNSYPELRGWMGNNELMLLQFPRSFYFLNSLWDAQYPEKKEKDVLSEISGHLYLDHKDLIADSFLALHENDPEKIASTLSSLNALTQNSTNLRAGAIGRFLFPNSMIVIRSLQLQLEIRLARQRLLKALQENPDKNQCEMLVANYFDTLLAWNQETGWEKTIDINIWRTPIYESDKALSEGMVQLKHILSDGKPYASYEQIEAFFEPIKTKLLVKYSKNSVMIGCIEPFKLSVLQSQ